MYTSSSVASTLIKDTCHLTPHFTPHYHHMVGLRGRVPMYYRVANPDRSKRRNDINVPTYIHEATGLQITFINRVLIPFSHFNCLELTQEC